MVESQIQKEIARRGSDKAKIAGQIIKTPQLLMEIVKGLSSEKASIKFGCAKVLLLISERKPEALYPEFDLFAKMLNSENAFLKWGAILTIANLTKADVENRFEKIFDRYFSSIPGPVMITAANTMRGGVKIALAKPHLVQKIAKEILKVEKAAYRTAECRNIALGHAIASLDQFYELIQDKGAVIDFVTKGLKNTRAAVHRKAERFLRKHPWP